MAKKTNKFRKLLTKIGRPDLGENVEILRSAHPTEFAAFEIASLALFAAQEKANAKESKLMRRAKPLVQVFGVERSRKK